jgi:predicted phosphodiesterase
LFKSYEHARGMVKVVRGQSGVKNKSGAEMPTRGEQDGTINQIPHGKRQMRPPFELPLPARVLVLSDLHIPFHSHAALQVAIDFGRKEKCDTVYLNGDSLDFYQLSRFVKDPRERDAFDEIQTFKSIMRILEKNFKRRYYKEGNHDERWSIALFQSAPWLAKFREVHLANVLELEDYGWGHIESKQRAEFGKLHVLHGHEASRGLAAPVNPARGVWLKIKATCLVGHWHQPSNHTEMRPLEDEVVASWSSGCLCDLEPSYAPINNWAHGFAIVDVGAEGNFSCQNFRILHEKDVYPA